MKTSSHTTSIEYIGYVPGKDDAVSIENDTLSPEDFYARYIGPRRPVILKNGLHKHPEWSKMKTLGDIDHLRKSARASTVKIEPVNPSTGSFGSSMPRQTVKFPEFLDILQDPAQRGKWYLTTQYEEDDEDEEDEETVKLDPLFPPPTDALARRGDFPIQPSVMGNLVLQQCNIWIGNSDEGASSGLHHDFHDNLYVLLRGSKRFVLFPPSAHAHLHLRGARARVHPNGLVAYLHEDTDGEGDEDGEEGDRVRADGLDVFDAARWRAGYWKRQIGAGGGREAKKRYMQAVEEVYEIRATRGEGGPVFGEGDEDEDDEEPAFGEEDDSDEEAGPVFGALAGGLDASDSDLDSFGAGAKDDFDALGMDVDGDADLEPDAGAKPEPPSFSRIPPAALHRHLGLASSKKQKKGKEKEKGRGGGPLPLPGCPPPLVASLAPGDMLYVPASWFHEVTSGGGTHVAFNYWFHPPDNLRTDAVDEGAEWTGIDWDAAEEEGEGFARPYRDVEVWDEIGRRVEEEIGRVMGADGSSGKAGRNEEQQRTKEGKGKAEFDTKTEKRKMKGKEKDRAESAASKLLDGLTTAAAGGLAKRKQGADQPRSDGKAPSKKRKKAKGAVGRD